MPGISFYYNREIKPSQDEKVIDNSIKSLLFTKRYSIKNLIEEKNYFVTLTKYEEYPFESFQSDKYNFLIEGKIYNKSKEKIRKELKLLAEMIFNYNEDNKIALSTWLDDTDGEFIIIILRYEDKRLAIFNDGLGRLPLYLYESDTELIITREISFITNLPVSVEMDSIGVAQFLFFGFPLGSRTLYGKIKRINPGMLYIIDPKKDNIKKAKIHSYNFDSTIEEGTNTDKIIDNLEELFLSASKNRCEDGFKNILSLSGGLDSRAVLAGLERSKIDYSAYTFLKEDSSNQSDVSVSEKLAQLFNINWHFVKLKKDETDDISFLLNSKHGLNELGMNFMVQFLRLILEDEGSNVLYITGDGGHRVLPSQSPSIKLGSLDKLTEYIISSRANLFTLSDVLNITGIHHSDFYNEIYDLLNSYPEKCIDNKYVHFQVFGRGYKWLFEGEDRNRYWFWSITPFYSQPFFNYSMMLPDRIKKNYNLQKQFLVRLSPEAAAERNAFWNIPITSSKLGLLLFMKDGIYPRLPSFMKRIINRHFNRVTINTNFLADVQPYLDELINEDDPLFKSIKFQYLKKIKNVGSFETEHLLTLLNLAKVLKDGRLK